jgi:hypothetical protein
MMTEKSINGKKSERCTDGRHGSEAAIRPAALRRALSTVVASVRGLAFALRSRAQVNMPRSKRKSSEPIAAATSGLHAASRDDAALHGGPSEIVSRVSDAGEALFAAAPWRGLPEGEALVGLTIPRYGVRDWVVTIIGARGLEPGLLLFRSMGDFEAYTRAASSNRGRGVMARMPSFLAFHYMDDPRRLGPAGRGGGARGRTLKSAALTPLIQNFSRDRAPSTPTNEEIEVVLAAAHAFAEPRGWAAIFARAKRDRRASHAEVSVSGRGVPTAVHLVAPFDHLERVLAENATHEPAPEALGAGGEPALAELQPSIVAPSPFEEVSAEAAALVEAFLALEDEDDELDAAAVVPLEHRLFDMFLAAPEGAHLETVRAAEVLLEFGRSHFGVSVFSIESSQLEEIVFEILPRKVMLDPGDARPIIEELRAFYRYLGRAFALPQAGECLEAIGPGAEEELEDALGDTEGFGVGKQILAAGAAAGFDIDTEEGLLAWMEHVREHGVPPGIRLPGAPPSPPPPMGPSRADKQKTKAKRKSAAAARKKNRPRR